MPQQLSNKKFKKKTLWPLSIDVVQLSQGCGVTTRGDTLLLTSKSPE